MRSRAGLAALLVAASAAAASAKPSKPKPHVPAAPAPMPAIQAQGRGTLQVEMKMTCRGKELSSRVLTLDGVQSNFVQKDPAKNSSFIFNFLPNVGDSGKDEVELQYQFECSELDKPSSTSQIQGVVRLQSAAETVVADSDGVQLKLKVSIIKYAR